MNDEEEVEDESDITVLKKNVDAVAKGDVDANAGAKDDCYFTMIDQNEKKLDTNKAMFHLQQQQQQQQVTI